MDIKTAALAASMIEDNLTKSGQIGRTEQNVFRFDGNTEGKASLDDLVLVSAKTPDLLTFVRATGVVGGVNVEITADSLTFETSEGESTANFAFFNDIPIFATVVGSDVEQLPNGLYLFSNDEGYISYIEFAETIHPMDSKYLPGVCLPMVELTTEPGLNAETDLTAAECATLNAAYEKKVPIVCGFSFFGMTAFAPMVHVNSPATSSGYFWISSMGSLYLSVDEAKSWTARFEA